MKTKEEIQNKISKAFDTLDTIENVDLSPFFKNKVLQKIQKPLVDRNLFTWFTPQLQLAVLAIIFIVNTTAVIYSFSNQEQNNSGIETFIQEYNLDSNNSSILN